MENAELTSQLKNKAKNLGFELCGICPASSPAGAQRLDEWLAAGYAGKMQYLAERQAAYHDPQLVLEGARSIIMLGMHYATTPPKSVNMGEGRVSRYAWGDADYHNVIRERLHKLADYIRELVPEAETRGVVDTAPLLEREFAQLAGLGWVGKNTMLISKKSGSYFFLAALLTDQELQYDNEFTTDHCGTCTACLQACPTDAFPQPYVLDASKCISYLTIELQEPIPTELRHGMGDWVFGCDICQDVCPWNRRPPQSQEAAFYPETEKNPMELSSLFEMDEASFRQRFRHTPLWRSHRRGLLRNAAIVLGNQGTAKAIPALTRGLSDPESMVRGASAWALGQIHTESAKVALNQRLAEEQDSEVVDEIRAALKQSGGVDASTMFSKQ